MHILNARRSSSCYGFPESKLVFVTLMRAQDRAKLTDWLIENLSNHLEKEGNYGKSSLHITADLLPYPATHSVYCRIVANHDNSYTQRMFSKFYSQLQGNRAITCATKASLFIYFNSHEQEQRCGFRELRACYRYFFPGKLFWSYKVKIFKTRSTSYFFARQLGTCLEGKNEEIFIFNSKPNF